MYIFYITFSYQSGYDSELLSYPKWFVDILSRIDMFAKLTVSNDLILFLIMHNYKRVMEITNFTQTWATPETINNTKWRYLNKYLNILILALFLLFVVTMIILKIFDIISYRFLLHSSPFLLWLRLRLRAMLQSAMVMDTVDTVTQ